MFVSFKDIFFICGLTLLLLCPKVAFTQQVQIPPSIVFNGSGTVVSITPGIKAKRITGSIIVKTSEGKRVDVRIPPAGSSDVSVAGIYLKNISPIVRVRGKLHASRLQKGMIVRFQAKVNTKNEVQGDIQKLELIDPTQKKIKPGLYPNSDGGAELNGDVTSYLIVAKINKISSRGLVTFSFPKNKINRKVKGTITEDAEIALESSNLMYYTQPNFKITIVGKLFKTQEIVPHTITINFPDFYKEPLPGKKKRYRNRKKKGKGSTKEASKPVEPKKKKPNVLIIN